MARELNSHQVEVSGASHAVYVSHPKEGESAAGVVWK